ncbi:MAG: hypothetical protein P8I51_03790 [Polaribacter sp.]|jgi:hypothetical protein|nr:hypothetical protein [Polaribacter sp.]MDG1953999.1 hypothetical protein [Polaribacter sp.]
MEIANIRFHFRNKMEVILNNNKSIIIEGEMMAEPEFEAYFNSINHWKSPFENEIISSNERKKLMNLIIEFSRQEKGIRVRFE